MTIPATEPCSGGRSRRAIWPIFALITTSPPPPISYCLFAWPLFAAWCTAEHWPTGEHMTVQIKLRLCFFVDGQIGNETEIQLQYQVHWRRMKANSFACPFVAIFDILMSRHSVMNYLCTEWGQLPAGLLVDLPGLTCLHNSKGENTVCTAPNFDLYLLMRFNAGNWW